MVFCEHCGDENKDGALFCAACGSTLQVLLSDKQEIDMIKSQTARVSPLQTDFKGFSPKQKAEVQQYVVLVVGMVIIISALAFVLPNSSTLVFPLGFIVMGLVLAFLVARQSSRDPLLFVAIAIGILTVGLGMLFDDFSSTDLIFSTGFFAFGLLVIAWSLKRILRVPSPPDNGSNFRG